MIDNDEEQRAIVEEQISEGMAVSDIIKTRGWKVLEKKLLERKNDLLQLLLDRDSLPEDFQIRMVILETRIELCKEIEFILSLPNALIKRSQELNERLNSEEKIVNKRLTKTSLNDPFMN